MFVESEPYIINIGPQHPSTHGGMHVEALMDGEEVVNVTIHLGYVHRSVEKIAESRTYTQFIPYAARLDYMSTNLPAWGYVEAVEKLSGLTVPERAQYIRVVMGELSRIASHMMFVGSLAIDLAATTGLLYCLRDRERIMDMLEMTSGQRLLSSYMRLGGVSHDLPEEFFPAVKSFLTDVPAMLDEYNGLITGNEILQARCNGIGVLTPETALAYGVTGPNLRASGISYDLRRADPYGIYDRFDFNIPVAQKGDCMARLMVRLEEIEQSARIIKQALEQMPEGEILGKVPKVLKPEKGREVYHRTESAKGELGYYLLADGTDKPARLHVRAPSFINLMVLPIISRGSKLQDIITNIATLDPVLGESDR